MSIDSDSGSEVSAICIPNISTRERRKRLAGGVISFVLAVAILAVLTASGASQWWRLVLFPLFFGAASGFFSGATKPEWAWRREVRVNWAIKKRRLKIPLSWRKCGNKRGECSSRLCWRPFP